MKAEFGQTIVDVWQVTLDEEPPAFIQQGLDTKQFWWATQTDGTKYIDSAHGIGSIIMAFIGDWITYGSPYWQRVTDKNFKKHYKIISE